MKDWISVKDSKPPKKVTVLAVVGVGKQRHIEMASYGANRNGAWWSVTYNNLIPARDVSHWQPIPELPPEGSV